jgi:flagellar hook-associated protein 2
MTTVDNSSSLQLTGLSSGLDTSSIVNSLMAVASLPKTALTIKQDAAQARQALLQQIETQLKTLSSDSTALQSASTWLPSQTASSADTTKVGAQITGGAGPGGYEVGVQNLASSEQHTYAYTPSASDSSLSIGSETLDVPANTSLDSVVATVNSDSNASVFAVNVNGNLVLAAKTTGAASAFTASSSTLVEDPTKARAGTDANYTVDGQPFTSSSNVVTNGLAGVTLTLNGKTSSDVTVTVGNPGPNAAGITAALNSFVSDYNTVVSSIEAATTQVPVPNAQNATDAAQGVLYDDPGLKGLLDTLRSTIGNAFSPAGAGASDPTLLSQIGLSTGAPAASGFNQDSVDGKLTLNATTLQSMLQSDPLGVQRLLGGVTGSDGLAQGISAVLDPETQPGGEFDQRISEGTSDLSDLSNQLSEITERLTARQTFLQNEFSQMEVALAQSQAQGAAIGAKLAALSTPSSSSS